MIEHTPVPHAKRDSRGAIATSRISGPLPTPADGFVVDLEALERATEELLERAESEGWARPSRDVE